MRRSLKIVYAYKNDPTVYEYNGTEEQEEDTPTTVEQSVRTITIERPSSYYESRKSTGILDVKKDSIPVKPKEVGSGGEGSQKFRDLVRQLKQRGELWEDPDFPAINSSLDSEAVRYNLEWKRPKEVYSDAKFIEDGATRFDIVQGNLGNCWFLAALGALCSDPNLLFRVVPKEQNFEDDYVGAFRFNFWQDDHWVEVIVDDRLPFRKNKLYFTQSANKIEFWTALMEKAYAKLNGSYEAMKAGYSSEALVDFTGGIVETFYLDEDQVEDFFDQIKERMDSGSLMTAGTSGGNCSHEVDIGNGLLSGHSYTVTGINKVVLNGKVHELIRLRNPWGGTEWRGPWSDNSSEWDKVDNREKDRLDLKIQEDGEFWMPFEDFLIYYDKLEVCHQSADVFDDGTGHWHEVMEKGSWIAGKTAGGCRTHLNTFHLNPRFEFDLNEESDRADGNGHLVISLIQTGRRKKGLEFLTIGFAIYKLSDTGPKVGPIFFRMKKPAASTAFINVREISGHFRLPVGRYFVVPSTIEPDEEADFILRIFKED